MNIEKNRIGRPRRLDGKRCPDCARTETVCDGPRRAKGATNGAQLWRCNYCDRQFIDGKVRGSKRNISANEAFARSVFVLAPPKQSKLRSDFFRYLEQRFDVGGRSRISYRTIYRWYVKWEALQAEEAETYPQKLAKASKAVQERVNLENFNEALSRTDAVTQAEFYRVLLDCLKIDAGVIGALDIKMGISATIQKLRDSKCANESRAYYNLVSAFTEVSKDNPYVYAQSDPIPHIRPFLPHELQE